MEKQQIKQIIQVFLNNFCFNSDNEEEINTIINFLFENNYYRNSYENFEKLIQQFSRKIQEPEEAVQHIRKLAKEFFVIEYFLELLFSHKSVKLLNNISKNYFEKPFENLIRKNIRDKQGYFTLAKLEKENLNSLMNRLDKRNKNRQNWIDSISEMLLNFKENRLIKGFWSDEIFQEAYLLISSFENYEFLLLRRIRQFSQELESKIKSVQKTSIINIQKIENWNNQINHGIEQCTVCFEDTVDMKNKVYLCCDNQQCGQKYCNDCAIKIIVGAQTLLCPNCKTKLSGKKLMYLKDQQKQFYNSQFKTIMMENLFNNLEKKYEIYEPIFLLKSFYNEIDKEITDKFILDFSKFVLAHKDNQLFPEKFYGLGTFFDSDFANYYVQLNKIKYTKYLTPDKILLRMVTNDSDRFSNWVILGKILVDEIIDQLFQMLGNFSLRDFGGQFIYELRKKTNKNIVKSYRIGKFQIDQIESQLNFNYLEIQIKKMECIMLCDNPQCEDKFGNKGKVNEKGKCQNCDWVYCINCFQIQKDNNHSCKESDIDHVNFLKENTRHCPRCGAGVQKVSGCAQVCCYAMQKNGKPCGTIFHYHNLQIQYGGFIHNPDYSQFIKKQNKKENIVDNYRILEQIRNMEQTETTQKMLSLDSCVNELMSFNVETKYLTYLSTLFRLKKDEKLTQSTRQNLQINCFEKYKQDEFNQNYNDLRLQIQSIRDLKLGSYYQITKKLTNKDNYENILSNTFMLLEEEVIFLSNQIRILQAEYDIFVPNIEKVQGKWIVL